MARDGSVNDNGGVLLLVNKDVEALIVKTRGDSDRRRDDHLGDMMDPFSTTSAV